jgi:hypothetical protein
MTRLAGEMTQIVSGMRTIDKNLPQLKAILDQVAAGADWESLATELGFADVADAETAYNLLGSLSVELAAAPFWNQVISRMG